MRITTALSGFLLTLGLALTGCSGDDPDDNASDGSSQDDSSEGDDQPDADDADDAEEVDVCAVVSAADLESLFGSPFDEGEATHHEQTGGDQCVWSNTDAPPVKVVSVALQRDGHFPEGFGGGDYTVKQLHEETKEYATDVEELDLGDDAYLSGSQIAVLDGDSSWTISITGTSPEAIDGLKQLAEQVVG